MVEQGRLLCPCHRAELTHDRIKTEIHEVMFNSLFDEVDMSSPPLREMWHGKGARRLGDKDF